MADNKILTHKMVARESAAILEEEAPFLANINKARQDEFGKNVQGFNKGDTVKIKIPTAGEVFDGEVFAEGRGASAVVEESVDLTLDTNKHVALQFGAKEKLLDITDFKERILRPQMQTLASVIEADLINRAMIATANQVEIDLAGERPSLALAKVRAKLNQFLTPASDRHILIGADTNIALSGESAKSFNPTQTASKAYLQGYVAKAYGAELYEHQSIGVFENGTANGITVNGSNQQGSVLLVNGTGELKKGTVFTIDGVNAVHPLTGKDLGVLQQFVVTQTVEVGGGTAVSIYPSLKDTAPAKTVSALAGNGAVMEIVSKNGFNDLAFHKDAFTTAFAPLPILASCEGYTARLPSGVSVRVMTFGDGNNNYERTRIDVLYGFTAVRPLHACRIVRK